MSFRLKNARVAYQRMVNRIYKNILGKNMEVYIDDMLLKSKTSEDNYIDLEEAFAIIWEYKMKLNPKKFTFRVFLRKFLGFIVISRGIEASLEKTKALIDMPSPRKHKDVQKLTGRIAQHSIFVSKTIDKSILFFNVL
uniref:Reverse transcriptase domain-containing protein n=1 Tax=Cannabis sativa TaxID=3483 RepID=A0A803Q7P4_CANSA